MLVTIERREHIRYDFPFTIDYVLSPKISDDILKGVTININDAGLCLYIFNPLPEGQKLTIKSILPVFCQTVTVRWIKKMDEDFYMAGLECA